MAVGLYLSDSELCLPGNGVHREWATAYTNPFIPLQVLIGRPPRLTDASTP